MDEVIESARYVSERSRWVNIDHNALNRFAMERLSGPLHLPAWDPAWHFRDGSEATVTYLLVLDTLNFCFWPRPGRRKWHVRFGTRTLDGYLALAAALKRAVETGAAILDPSFLQTVSPKGLARILGGRGDLPLMPQRAGALNELGARLLDGYEGRAAGLVEAAGGSAVGLARRLSRELSSFRDGAVYAGRDVWFLKRAQIFAADLHGAFGGRGWGAFSDMDRLTAFADYKLPQVLRHAGILVYGEPLARKVDRRMPLSPGGAAEVEIRGNTVWCVERIRRSLLERGISVHAFRIDWLLWNLGQQDAFRKKPYHRTRTIYY